MRRMSVKDAMQVGVAGSGSGVGVEVAALAGTHISSARACRNELFMNSGIRQAEAAGSMI